MNHEDFSFSTGKVWSAVQISTTFLRHRETQRENTLSSLNLWCYVFQDHVLMHLAAGGQLSTFIWRISGKFHLESKASGCSGCFPVYK